MNETSALPTPQCPYCGGWPHQRIEQCPAIKSIEYYPDGTIKIVEKKD